MSVDLQTLDRDLKALLRPEQFNDYCPNGLQVQGRAEVGRIVTGVTACRALIEAAVANGADLLLVHHGYFWRGEDPTLTGLRRERIRALLHHDLSLMAYHLPLDVHPELGNNAQLGQRLGMRICGGFGKAGNQVLGLVGEPEAPLSGSALAERLTRALNRDPQHIDPGPRPIRRIGWCTGAAQGQIEAAIAEGVDAYISGEISEPTVHIAREAGIHYFAAGHHATERYGVQAVGAWLAQRHGLTHTFVDIDNPV